MFSAILSDGKLFRDSIDTISQLIDEASLKITPAGFEILAADRAMVTVVHFRLPKDSFEEYNCEVETAVGVNMLNFLSILKRAGPKDKLSIKLNNEQNRFEIFLKGSSIRAFTLPILDMPKEEVPDINKFEFPAIGEVDTSIIIRGVDDADIVADSVGIELSQNGFRMFASSGSSNSELKLSADELNKLDATQLAKSKYPIDYMKKVMKAGKICNTVRISVGNDYPIKLEFLGGKAMLSFIVAPRVSED
jgi:proliferating cell nuclear antigen